MGRDPDLEGDRGPGLLTDAKFRGDERGERLIAAGDVTAELSLGESGPFPPLPPPPPSNGPSNNYNNAEFKHIHCYDSYNVTKIQSLY